MNLATAFLVCKIGVGLTVVLLAAAFCSFALHLFVLPTFGLPFPMILMLLPALGGIALYQRALKAEAAKDSVKAD